MTEGRERAVMRTRTVLLTALVAVAYAAGPAVAVAGAADVTLTVTVETEAENPVDDAELTATWEGGSATETTRSNGQALIDVPQGADVTIEVDHPDYIRNSPFRLNDATQRDVQITVYEKGSAQLTVVDTEGPVQNARVELRKGGEIVASRTTDSQGEIESGVIESGDYTVTLFKAGYFRESVSLDVQGDVSEQLQMERGSASVTFLVLDENFDPPRRVAEATISGPDFNTVTQGDGTRTVSVPVNSQLQVTVEKEGYEPVQSTFLVREQDRRVNLTTRKLPAVSVDVPNQRVVVGEALQVTVTDQYGEPMPEAVVYLDGESVGQPNNEGVLRVPVESAGDHSLYAEFDQLSSDTLTITGVEEGAGSGDTAPPETTATTEEPETSLSLPGLGDVDLGSTAVGIAAGVVLAVVLFVYVRIR